MQLVICLLSHFIHIWCLGWRWSEHAHIIPISRMVVFCKIYTPFPVCLTIHPSAYLVYATSHLSLSHFIHIWYLGWPWSEHAHIILISRVVDISESYSPFHVCLTISPFPHLVYATSHLSLLDFIHLWYLHWPWSEHVHIMPISRMVNLARFHALFMFVWPYVRPHILCT